MSQEASQIVGLTNRVYGSIKENVGSFLGDEKMELEGKATRLHGINECDYAQAGSRGEAEPPKFRAAAKEAFVLGTEIPSPHDTANSSKLDDQFAESIKESIEIIPQRFP